MFEGFAGVWTPVEASQRVGAKPVAVRLAGENVALFRDGSGRVGALIDRCPHRGVALSLGHVSEDGCLECPFHGWRFDRGGNCQKVPLNDVPAAKRERYGATALPAREAGDLIWIYTGIGESAPEEPYVPEVLKTPGWSLQMRIAEWKTHWTRAMENMIDWPHLPYVHRSSIGRKLRQQMRADSVMQVEIEDRPYGMRIFSGLDDASRNGVFLDWLRPNGMELHIFDTPKRRLRLQIYCVPIDAVRTRMILISARDFGRFNPLLKLGELFNRKILLEDQGIVESSQPAEVPPPQEEVSVATDAPTLAFRRYYHKALKPSRVEGPGTRGLVPASALAGRSNGAANHGGEAVATEPPTLSTAAQR